ncbi:MAG TPA: DinB family protein [Candidatus Cybelea sp.]|nr:DinB family protein [Candidatus Cybelea sp.]
MNERALRDQLRKALGWGEAHLTWKNALAGVPPEARGKRPVGAPHSLWELLEHARIAQRDILEFSRNPKHVSPDFPSGYWPKTTAPSSDAAWKKSATEFFADMDAMGQLVADPRTDLLSAIPHGSGQTILREALLLADHNSYHLGQFVLVRRLLGYWKD